VKASIPAGRATSVLAYDPLAAAIEWRAGLRRSQSSSGLRDWAKMHVTSP
jgi:hypothetical protein